VLDRFVSILGIFSILWRGCFRSWIDCPRCPAFRSIGRNRVRLRILKRRHLERVRSAHNISLSATVKKSLLLLLLWVALASGSDVARISGCPNTQSSCAHSLNSSRPSCLNVSMKGHAVFSCLPVSRK